MSASATLRVGRLRFPIARNYVRHEFVRDGLEIGFLVEERDRSLADCIIANRERRKDLIGHIGETIPVAWDGDGRFTGYYTLRSDPRYEALDEGHVWQVTLQLDRVGSHHDLLFESQLTGAQLGDEHAIALADTEALHAPPPHDGYDPGGAAPAFIDRTLASGHDLRVYRDVPQDTHPKFSTRPEDFYVGACLIERTQAELPALDPVAGREWPGEVEGLRLSNGLVRFTALSTGRPILEFFDGSKWVQRDIEIRAGGSEIPDWAYVTIMDNRPEMASLRYWRSFTGGKEWLDVTARRGMRGLMFVTQRSVAADLGVQSSTAMTRTTERMVEDSADSANHKLVFSAANAFTATAASGRMESTTSVELFDFFVGYELNGAPAGDTALDLSMQYHGYRSEEMQVLRP